jgi:nucleoid-associated protein YgaU
VRTGGRPARPGDHAHTVHPGESLWAIAADVLGGDAGPAHVAREVHRLWTLNRDRIGTGDPDLLMVGTSLALQ